MHDARFILIHYHEIGLKGKNRGKFERRLMTNIIRALKDVPCGKLERLSGRMMLALTSESPIDIIRERLATVFGIANFSEAVVAKRNIEAIRETAWTPRTKNRFPILQNCHQTRRQNLSAQFGSNQPGRGQAYSNPVRFPRPDGQPRPHLFY